MQGCVLGELPRVRAKVPETLPFCYNQPLFLQEVPITPPAGAGRIQVGKGQWQSLGDRWGAGEQVESGGRMAR